MIKEELNSIEDITVGEIQITKVYNGSNIIWLKNLPYDAEVEYLESSGDAYIDTGIECTGDLKVEFEGLVKTNVNAPACGGIFIPDTGSVYFRHHWTPTLKNFYWIQYSSSNNASVLHTSNVSTNTWYKVVIDPSNGTGSINGVSKTFTKISASRTTGLNYFIFARKNSTGTISSRPCRFKSFKMWINGTLLRDFITVRVGQVGYMYDKVTGRLFGNSGTGNFIMGSDIQQL